MIEKIYKINFKSFNNDKISNIDFKKVNLIYGLNGKGKSSFAQFLREYIGDKNIFKCSQKEYKIFNYDELYKRNTLYINDDDKQDTFNSFYLGEDIATIIKDRNAILEKINKAELIKQNKEKERQRNNNEIDKLKEEIARTTRNILNIIDSNKYKNPQSYTKVSIKDDNFKSPNILNDDEFENCKKHSINNIPDKIDSFTSSNTQKLSHEIAIFKQMLKEAPENQAIERFKQDSELESFAKEAIKLKNKYPQEYNEKCPLCEQNILQLKLWENLEKHFNQEYQSFIEKLDRAKIFFENAGQELNQFTNWLNKNLIATKILHGKDVNDINIDNLRQEYLEHIGVINKNLEKLLQKLQQKLNAPNNKDIEFNEEEGFAKSIEKILSDELKNIIVSHNEKQANYQKTINENIEKIKQHFIAKEKDIFLDIQRKIAVNDRNIKRIENYIKCYDERIAEIDIKLKEIDKSFEQLNSDLKEWFFEDIRFEKISDNYYKIQRQDCNEEWFDCKSGLSEGEKTIISIIYFINYYLANLSNLKECPILIIDDPITSLDSQNKDKIVNYIVQKIQSNNRGQLFILSHDKVILNKFAKDLKEYSAEKQILEIYKIKLSSEFRVLEIKLENDLREIYNKLKEYINNENIDNIQHIKELPRQLLEGLFAIIFKNTSNFTYCYDKILTKYGMQQGGYSAGDIQKLNHNKNSEENNDEVLNKCKFVVKIFEKFIQD